MRSKKIHMFKSFSGLSFQMKGSVPSEFNLAALFIFQPVLEDGVQVVSECPPPATMETISKQGSKV